MYLKVYIVDTMTNDLTEKIFAAYKDNDRDHNKYKLQDKEYGGIQIIRNYPSDDSRFVDEKEFIKFYVDREGRVRCGVDMVKRSDGDSWTTQDTSGLKKVSNYFSNLDEGVRFDSEYLKIFHKRKTFNVTEFIDYLEKKHLCDMFWLDRNLNRIRKIILHIIFGFVDRRYQYVDYLFRNRTGFMNRDVETRQNKLKPDPLFRFFYLYKTPFAFILGVSIPVSYFLSKTLDSIYFSIQNPFLILSTMGIFLLIEGFGTWLNEKINDKGSFVVKLAERTLQEKGKL